MEIFIATANEHKVYEFKKMLEPLGYSVKSMLDLEEEVEIDETGTTFEENSIIKASTMAKLLHIPCIADDSGLEVDALGKKPGIESARFMGHDTSYDIKNRAIMDMVKDAEDRTCRFVSAIALCEEGKEPKTFVGTVEGSVAYEIVGAKGFGYDPIFYYEPYGTTLANVSDEMKNAVSHRGKALRLLVEYLNENR
ncbi:MAG: RdgB/HAM1 family non-canonical purine NTP pyrophosphatase [Erysipelotrichaceae bacterium]|nr:RdgB/HAM1 family non-canonical purine NTP pyrophosphatase [Erysipelotrichaceae bacterium]